MPKVDPGVNDVRKDLFTKYKTFQKGAEKAPKKPIEAYSAVLEDADIEVLSGRFSTLLWATTGAFTRITRAQRRNANEAERRHDWDAMLYRFFVGSVQPRNNDAAPMFSLDVLYVVPTFHAFYSPD